MQCRCDLGHDLVDSIHFGDHFFGFIPGEDSGNAFGFGRANWNESRLVQLDIEDIAIQEQDGADGLVPLAPPARAGVSGG